MATEQTDIKVIRKKDADFPEWLDFDKLRSEGIAYIGKLAGKIWTDHNVHDPGITTLEVLCYALLDLGYRTNLPAADVFARDPEITGPDDNFLTPSEILTNNPLTITDFRKLLIDIPRIKNAWLEIATDQDANKFCDQAGQVILKGQEAGANRVDDECCLDYLNGLYHVYIDTEENINDKFPNQKDKDCYIKCLIENVKKALMAHRNICEDFVDIKILCKWRIGICAKIELEENADPEKVYLEMVEKLRQFFSPSPRFYTLEQMLEKNKTIDEIFAGRPYDIRESHGFVDVEELEKLELRKSIHVSDVYNVLFSIEGISKLQSLRLMTDCKEPKKTFLNEWIVKIPEDNIPDFDHKCSGFEFNRSGIPVSFDFKKYDALLDINFEHNGKILYQSPSNKLDLEIPRGTYHKDLGSYYSIQHDFPRVYGVTEGGLPADASDFRKAQALQFKGYLLFFDHLLSNYLSQLQNIRSLFPVRSSKENTSKKATYFSSVPGNVPDLQQLIRYKVDQSSDYVASETGFLAFPVDKNYFQTLIDLEEHKYIRIEDLPYYRFGTSDEKNIAIAQLQDDMINDALQIEFVTKNDECVYYYVLSSSNDFALVSRKYYKDVKAAMLAAASIKYAGTVRTNYNTSLSEFSEGYTFSVDLNITGYAGFLQQLTENDSLFVQRRHGFLDHLLSRFAEKFTDFALLSYSFYSQEDLQSRDARAKAFYLSNYSLFSGIRGKGFDYTLDGWNTDNNSGYEKKIRGLLGHEDLKRSTLCNFDVYDYGEKFSFQLKLYADVFIKTDEKFNSREEARNAARDLFQALGLRSSYRPGKVQYSGTTHIFINYGHKKDAELNLDFNSPEEAGKAAEYFYKIIAIPQANGKVDVLSYRYTVYIFDQDNNIVRTLSKTSSSEGDAKDGALTALNNINEPSIWGAGKEIGKLSVYQSQDTVSLIDEGLFKPPDIDNNIIGEPNLYNYELMDKGNHFLFRSYTPFGAPKDADDAYRNVIRLLARKDNLLVRQIPGEKKWTVFMADGDNLMATCSVSTDTETAAEELKEEIWKIIRPAVYELKAEPKPDTWKFQYTLGYEESRISLIESSQIYHSETEAVSALVDFCNSIGKVRLEKKDNEWLVVSNSDGNYVVIGHLSQNSDANNVSKWLSIQKEISEIKENQNNEEAFSKYVDVHEDTQCHYVYHLADKDGLYAVRTKKYPDVDTTKKALAESIQVNPDEYNILELHGSGSITEYIEPATHTRWYHYQLKSSNNIPKPGGGETKKLVLFESSQGYLSREEAEKAYAANYMEILYYGLNKKNYGHKKTISEKYISYRDDDGCTNKDTLAYVPEQTLQFLGTYPEQAILELVEIVKTFPIRALRRDIEEDADTFNYLFLPCDQIDDKDCPCKDSKKPVKDCDAKKEPPVYYFALDDIKDKNAGWHSVKYYETAAEAMQAFKFFFLLLKHEGNYTASRDCTGNYAIYIREVLAESRLRFLSKALAWGPQGVQKFIKASQTPYSFHAYADDDCCYRFFVACKNIQVIHPCKYDSPEIRDRALKQLQYFLPGILNWKFDYCHDSANFLFDFEGNKLATFTINEKKPGTWKREDRLNDHIDIFSFIGNYPLDVDENKNVVRLDNCNGLTIDFELDPASAIKTLEELKEKLLWLACYFPFVKKEKKETISYCIEIRIPGFNACENCSPGTIDPCPAAWISECCFDDCGKLLDAYNTIITWLKEFRFYKPVFDCPCGAYGIELYEDAVLCIDNAEQKQNGSFKLPEIIAYSPQCYPNAEMVCDAIERAKRLINSEGLHLVEHILLRPHCVEDCECLINTCSTSFDKECKFPNWVPANDDPCDKPKPVCFKPGQDPYSFIATVVLPAWPERFRRKENRKILENMIYREAPAHVALRILWLTPHDLCCFEKNFKRWLMWTAYQESRINSTFKLCDLIKFLFTQKMECWDNDEICKTCNQETVSSVPCLEKIDDEAKDEMKKISKDKCDVNDWYQQMNELYCWEGKNCPDDDNYEEGYYKECDEFVVDTKPLIAMSLTIKPEIVSPEMPAVKKQSTDQFLNGRRALRKKKVNSLAKTFEEKALKELAGKANRYLDSGTPSPASFTKLISDLTAIKDKKLKDEKEELISSLVHFYMDKTVFGEKEPDLTPIQSSLDLIKTKGIDVEKIYQKWEPRKAKEHLPAGRHAEIKKLFRK